MDPERQTRTAPPAVEVDLDRENLRSYWLDRVAQHTQDSYAGITLCKFPEDLRTYEHLLWEAAPDTVIELGTYCGASALWFRDRLRTLRGYGRIHRAPLVITVDLDQALPRASLLSADPSFEEEIELIEADVTDPALPGRVGEILHAGARCMVIEDSAHCFETTYAALAGFSDFVPPGGFFVVEDGCVDVEEMRPEGEAWPRGVLPALDRWLATPQGGAFEVRRDLEVYGISCHPRGFLQRRR
jgi:cephalosporin hydroxylase